MLNHPSTTIFAVASTCGSDTCNSVTSTAAQRSLQVQCETSNATGSGNIGNVCSSNDTGQLCRQNQTTPWSLMNVFPQHSAHAATTSRGTFFNEPSSLVHMRYGSAGGNEEVGKDQQMNPTLYQLQSDLSIVKFAVALVVADERYCSLR
ncbi:unnamed protein product [Enterobius vermicularis]|uniref:Uncharacterized protein n=1 Tax=Enterobius vermicularis TaxID=51028 RepID=A0A0N4UUU0_ENTVE|nr:unnamed protein product [Enterobius vermicularis]